MTRRSVNPFCIGIVVLLSVFLMGQDSSAQSDPCVPDPCEGISNAVPATCAPVGGSCTPASDFSCSCDPGFDWQDATNTCVDPGVEMGSPLGIGFDPQGFVNVVLVEVLDAWLTDPTISLDIEITGLNGGFAHHGADLVDVIDTTVDFTDGLVAETLVDWTSDTIPQHVNETYTICVQPLRNTTELIGAEKCAGYGPF